MIRTLKFMLSVSFHYKKTKDRRGGMKSNELFYLFLVFVCVAVSFASAKTEILLNKGIKLNKGDYSLAPQNSAFLRLQNDGNLVLKKGTPDSPKYTIWASGTKTKNDCFARIQVDGNLVIYEYRTDATDGSTIRKAIFSTKTSSDFGIYHVAIDSNERIIIVKESAVDGKLVEHWSNQPSHLLVGDTLISGRKIINPDIDAYLNLQSSDGNLVLREGTSGKDAVRTLWSSAATSSAGRYFLRLENTGILNVYEGVEDNPGPILWSSGVEESVGEYYFTLDEFTNRPTVLSGNPEVPGKVLWEAKNTKKPVFVFVDKNNGNLVWIKRDRTIILSQSIISFDHFDDEVVWSELINGMSKVFVFNGSTTIPISGDNNVDRNPHISKRRISFEREKYANGKTFYQVCTADHNGNNLEKVSDLSSANESSSDLNGDEIVYLADIDGNDDVFHYDGTRNYRITQTTQSEFMPAISREYIVWAEEFNGFQNVLAYDGFEIFEIFNGAFRVRSILVDRSKVLFHVWLDEITHALYLWQPDTLTRLEFGDYDGRPVSFWDFDMKGNYIAIGVESQSSVDTTWFIKFLFDTTQEGILKHRESGRRMEPSIFGNYILYQEAPGGYWDDWSEDYSTWIYNIWTGKYEVIKEYVDPN